ncbi:MAG: nitrilase-related carbon-nitrogen hydrolase [Planctomycetota bacterium]
MKPDEAFEKLFPADATKRLPLLTRREASAFAAAAAASFHLAFCFHRAGFLIAVFAYCAFNLARVSTVRAAVYGGLALGLLLYAPHLLFFWGIFGPPAMVLWLVLPVWFVAFLLLARVWVTKGHRVLAAAAVPLIWLGVEYFRGELYYLRFTWLSPGYALSHRPPWLLTGLLGMYGTGFLLMLVAGAMGLVPRRARVAAGSAALALLAVMTNLPAGDGVEGGQGPGPLFVGVQTEDEDTTEVVARLEKALSEFPDADVLVLPEYTFHYGIPEEVTQWCRDRRRWLIAGTTEPVESRPRAFRNTACVVSPEGGVVFRQVKSVPIQFFMDGLPAERQELWESPWGKVGICICYDLSYTRVTDGLVARGAELIVVPTMDVASWGRREHELHARVAPVRAAEYGVPVFRVASSGISQAARANGTIAARAPFPGAGEVMAARITLREGSRPLDRFLWPVGLVVCGLSVVAWVILRGTMSGAGSSERSASLVDREPSRGTSA